jgi:hypothetical protein
MQELRPSTTRPSPRLQVVFFIVLVAVGLALRVLVHALAPDLPLVIRALIVLGGGVVLTRLAFFAALRR